MIPLPERGGGLLTRLDFTFLTTPIWEIAVGTWATVFNLRAEIVAAGFDPFVGMVHGTSQNRIPFVYDLMEPVRPTVDRKILEFALARIFTPRGFHD